MLLRKKKTPGELAYLNSVAARMVAMSGDLVRGREAGLASRLGAVLRDLLIAIENAEEEKS